MSHALDGAASRFGRDRDLVPEPPSLGPYESPYDVRRGYQQPLRRAPREEGGRVLLFRKRDEAKESGTDAGEA